VASTHCATAYTPNGTRQCLIIQDIRHVDLSFPGDGPARIEAFSISNSSSCSYTIPLTQAMLSVLTGGHRREIRSSLPP
jgi:hypothetical protein